ncbi:type VII secretion integral membrane protein EccD [Actinomycetospora sp. TBRC 11914]|uniref:type VII secretion integral membrane protein EccD n=1 Tax=Actinomycetospora sp. TBRC 11914 TaxID=2729387 RepID=UPI00145D7395|nr:type VII secretion integral membrane protein EccD [Actinomycetospora sp. TBRC 11914]NMO93439.1 type VII secretion integral membrane protein EccD [Actinomycetospora sp. TBRC 11914]
MSTGTGRGHAPAALGRPPSGPAAPPGAALTPAPFPAPDAAAPVTRISVLAPSTRVDVALPGDVPVAELLGVLVEMTERPDPDGADERPARHGDALRSADRPGGTAWTLAPLGGAPVDPRQTLDGLGVLDGDQLVLRRRADAAPAPLYDDVVDAVAESSPASYRPWDEGWAHALGLAGAATAGAVALGALVAAGRGPGTAGGLVTAGAAALLAILAGLLGAAAPRLFSRPGAAAVLGPLATAAAAVCGLAAVPSDAPDAGALTTGAGTPHLLLAAALALVAAGSTLLGTARADRVALAVLVGLATAAGIATLVGAVATVVGALAAARGAEVGAPAVAAGAGAVALVVLSALPRLGVALARLPLPQVPASAAELADDAGPGDPASLDRRADRAHAVLAGLAAGTVAVLAAAAAVLAAVPADGWQGTAGWVLAVLLVLLPALRSRSYANALPASVLLVGALVGGAAVGVGAVAAAPAGAARVGIAVAAVVVGVLTVVLGSVLPRRRASPGARRAVDLLEGVGIAAVIPLALAVCDLYTAVRLL